MKRPAWLVAVVFVGAGLASAQPKLKIYISADMEGVGGVVSNLQTGPGQPEYERFRRFMTAEVIAAIEAAKAAGATEIVVSDSHGNGQNILVEELPTDIKLIRSWPRPLGMMEGIDNSFDAAVFLGYHAGEGTAEGVLAHTMVGNRVLDVKLNGVSMPEAGISAALAGHFGVPVVFVAGDQTAVRQTRELLGDIEGVEVKRAIGVTAAETLPPVRIQQLIKDKLTTAIRERSRYRPYKLPGPVTLQLTLKRIVDAELLAMLPDVRRVRGNAVEFRGKDMVEVSKFIVHALSYNAQ